MSSKRKMSIKVLTRKGSQRRLTDIIKDLINVLTWSIKDLTLLVNDSTHHDSLTPHALVLSNRVVLTHELLFNIGPTLSCYKTSVYPHCPLWFL